MLKQFNFIMILVVSVFLTGCAADSGNTKLAKTSNEQINSAFVKGKTTQAEVKEAFGEPNDTDIMSDGQVKWVYSHIKLFKDGILVDFSSSTAKGETKAGVLS